MSELEVSTRALAALLGALQPQAIDQLRARFPQEQDLFDPTFTLGTPPVADRHLPLRRHRQVALRALIDETLAASKAAIPLMVEKISDRMRRARAARLAGGLAAAIGASLVAAQASGALPKDLQLLWSAVSLAGALLVLWGEHLEKPVIGGQRSLAELLSEVLVAETAMNDIRLRMLSDDAEQSALLMENARRANEAAARIPQVSVFGGINIPPGLNPVDS